MRATGKKRKGKARAKSAGGSDESLRGWRQLAEFLGIDEEADRGSMGEATFYACLRTLSESVGKLPCKLLRRNERNGVTVERGHPLYRVLVERPNRFMTAAGFWSTVELNRSYHGNAYVYVSGWGERTQLWPLPSSEVTIVYDDAMRIDRVPDVYYVWNSPEGQMVLGSEEVLHFRTSDTFDGVAGVSVRERLASTIRGNRDAQKVLNGLYDTNLSQKTVMQYTADISTKSAEKMAKLVSDYASGKARERGIGDVIPVPLGVTLTPLNMKLADTQFLELRKYSAIQIASAFGIKPYQIGDYGKESYSSQDAQQLAFYKDTMLWILSHYEQEITYKLLADEERAGGLHAKFNVSAMLRADMKTQIETLVSAVSNFIYTPDEARAMLDLEAKEGGDELIGNGSTIPLSQVGVQYAKDGDGRGGGDNNGANH